MKNELVSIIFAIIAVLHLIRSVFSLPATISNFNIPLYFSYLAVVVFGFLSWYVYDRQ